MKHFVTLATLCFLAAFAGPAEADVITFNALTPTTNPILGSIVCADTTGFQFLSDHFHLIGGDFGEPFTSNGTSHVGYEAGRGFPITMARVGGGTFTLLSLDAGEFHSPEQPDRRDAETIKRFFTAVEAEAKPSEGTLG